ncbi:PhzF family phenazine biosynthesis protein [Aspergillus clavatus NRRL 1]|uniref:Phenazine biosynthesis-like protein, putative n=1 Tax=Aspergillus clavatus (strain ATCC 1007 / CBS 513.65 / DSM 816 / NCTC 3887 / NRRL 1 / QM 1276 / 107) TaxID=344612 RepID=A1C929_ASPCL|nr:phenazine biosynthesis-like protein, putative [Aspergillus clavatus NRRL 1]EAW13353.1 phenazine biosynthesis-like protein, putative [Aspergillus clavatus NRRL 1]
MAQQVRFVTLDVFTSQPYTGNPLAVVFLPDSKQETLTQSQKQSIAREFNLSETIFVHADNGEKRTIDIFTTDCELPFAGHPTIGAGTWFLSLSQDDADKGVVRTLATKSGDIPIALQAGQQLNAVTAKIAHNVRLHQSGFPLQELIRLHPFLSSFFNLMEVAKQTFPVFSIVNGMSQIHVELPSVKALGAVTTATSGEVISAGCGYLDEGWDSGLCVVYFFVRNVKDPQTGANSIRTRAIIGNLEDPATGSAASGLAAYLSHKEGKPGRYKYNIIQGVEMGRRSEIGVEVVVNQNKQIESVELQGGAVKVSEGTILIPPA